MKLGGWTTQRSNLPSKNPSGCVVAVSDIGAGDRPNPPFWAADPAWKSKIHQNRKPGVGTVYGGSFPAMELTTVLNRCHRFRGFVYEHARFTADRKSIEVVVRPRKGSAAVCSRCHQPAPGYDQLAERRFEFIPIWGFFVFLWTRKGSLPNAASTTFTIATATTLTSASSGTMAAKGAGFSCPNFYMAPLRTRPGGSYRQAGRRARSSWSLSRKPQAR
jgi:hypothetical protein